MSGVPIEALQTRNIRLSVQNHVKTTFATPNSIPVGYNDNAFDPDAHSDGASPVPVWVVLYWLDDNAGTKGFSLLQIDVFTRRTEDPLGDLATRTADLLIAAMRVRSIDLSDFSSVAGSGDSEAPIAGHCILIQAPNGRVGERSGKVGPFVEGENWRTTLTYRLRLLTDASPGDYFPSP